MKTILQKVSFVLLLLLIALSAISNHPIIVEMSRNAGIERGSVLSRFIIAVFALLFICCFDFNSLLKNLTLRSSIIIWLLVFISALGANAFFSSRAMYGDIRAIAICIGALAIGWLIQLDTKQYWIVLFFFSIITTFVGLMQVTMNIGGFVIEDALLTDNKNALGVMLATAAYIFWHIYLNIEEKRISSYLLLVVVVLLIIIMLTTRVRSASLIIVFMMLLSYYKHKPSKYFGLYFIGIVILCVCVLVFFPTIREFIYDSFFQNSQGDITSGRFRRNAAGWHFLGQNLLFGQLGDRIYLEQIHNYPLNKICAYGLLFSLPILTLYVFLLIKNIKGVATSNSFDNWNIGYYILLIPYINSLSEPSLPFGPGTATVFNFILFGIALHHTFEWDHKSL